MTDCKENGGSSSDQQIGRLIHFMWLGLYSGFQLRLRCCSTGPNCCFVKKAKSIPEEPAHFIVLGERGCRCVQLSVGRTLMFDFIQPEGLANAF